MKNLKFISAFCFALLSGCATEKLHEPRGSFSVKVVPYFGNDVHIFVQAFERNGGQRGPMLSSKRVTGDGVTGFVLPLGKTYGVRAYADLDHDGKQGPDDPSANVDGLQPVADVNMQQAPAILVLPGAGVSPEWPGRKGDAQRSSSTSEALLQKGKDKLKDVAPGLTVPSLPVPPPPLPVPPPPR